MEHRARGCPDDRDHAVAVRFLRAAAADGTHGLSRAGDRTARPAVFCRAAASALDFDRRRVRTGAGRRVADPVCLGARDRRRRRHSGQCAARRAARDRHLRGRMARTDRHRRHAPRHSERDPGSRSHRDYAHRQRGACGGRCRRAHTRPHRPCRTDRSGCQPGWGCQPHSGDRRAASRPARRGRRTGTAAGLVSRAQYDRVGRGAPRARHGTGHGLHQPHGNPAVSADVDGIPRHRPHDHSICAHPGRPADKFVFREWYSYRYL